MKYTYMTNEICKYYLEHTFQNKPEDEVFIRHENSDKIAVIIEPRFEQITEQVIYNFMHFLNPLGFNLLIVTYSDNRPIIESRVPYAYMLHSGEQHIYFDSSGNPNINIDSYNMILCDPELWQIIPAETIVIFQRDCIMFREFSDHFLLYDYAGSNYLINHAPLFGGINGGFSIRKRSVMLECLEKITWEDIFEYRRTRKHAKCYGEETPSLNSRNEDVFFTHACEILCKSVPDMYTRTFLCIENDFNPQASVHHGWNKGYMSVTNLISLLSSSPLFYKTPTPTIINE